MPRTIGPGPALEMLLTNRRLTAADARFGLVHRVVSRNELRDVSAGLAAELASRVPRPLLSRIGQPARDRSAPA